ncbi:MAG: hypothetical protein IKL82_00895 [Clostridia bacterium]|nr:hypothetical protein [Clostridia bacterium]
MNFNLNEMIKPEMLESITDEMLASIEGFVNAPYTFLAIIAVAILVLILAFNSYKMFKLLIGIAGAVGGAYAGYTFLVPLLPLEGVLPGVNLGAVIALACAGIGALVGYFLYMVGIFAIGGWVGWTIGLSILASIVSSGSTAEFFQQEYAVYIFGGVGALILAILFVSLFKHVMIIIPSLVLCTSISSVLGLYVGFDFKQIPAILSELKLGNPVEIDFTTTIIVIGVFAVIGLIVGIFAMSHQYKVEKENA